MIIRKPSAEFFMNYALKLAQKSYQMGEVPIGAVIELNGRIIGEGYNQIEKLKDPTAHAEMLAITAACNYQNSWRLNEATIYTTIEPCMMCSGAIILSRIKKVVYGAKDERFGCCNTNFNPIQNFTTAKNLEIVGGVLEEESKALIQTFFRDLRKKK